MHKNGIICKQCGGRDFEVTHTRRMYAYIRRRRICRVCGGVNFTIERTADDKKMATGSPSDRKP